MFNLSSTKKHLGQPLSRGHAPFPAGAIARCECCINLHQLRSQAHIVGQEVYGPALVSSNKNTVRSWAPVIQRNKVLKRTNCQNFKFVSTGPVRDLVDEIFSSLNEIFSLVNEKLALTGPDPK